MPSPAPRFVLLLSLIANCADSTKTPAPPPATDRVDCTTHNSCEPVFQIWSPAAQAILIEKLGKAYAKDEWAPALFLERAEMSAAQLQALDQWSLLAETDALNCSLAGSDLAYKAVIFDQTGGRQVYYGAESTCGEAGGGAYYIPISYFQDFPGEIPYRPQTAGDYVIEKVVMDQHSMKVDLKYSNGCASYRNFTLIVDSKLSESSPPVINAYIRHRTDNDCAATGRSRLEFDLTQYDLHGAELLKLKGWTKRQTLPGPKK